VPVLGQWLSVIAASGSAGVLLLVASVGTLAWAFGKTQGASSPPPPPPHSDRGADAGGGQGNASHSSGSHSSPPPHTPRQDYSTPPPRQQEYKAPPPPPQPEYSAPPPQPEYFTPPPPPRPEQSAPPPQQPHAEYNGQPKPTPSPAQPRAAPSPAQPKPATPAQSRPDNPSPTKPAQSPTSATRSATDAAASWEKAREETRKREEARKKAEELKKLREETLRKKEEAERQARASAEKIRWEQARAREKEARERETRERKAKEKEEKEKQLREKEKREREIRERIAKENKERAAAAARSPPKPAAKHTINPSVYDARTVTSASTASSYTETLSSYAPSTSTARTSPPLEYRGPYNTSDPDKIVIQAVYMYTNALPRKPVSQLVSGQANVTDGLVLRLTTEGLFIDDDVRRVPQREWDIKAWSLKSVERGALTPHYMLRATIRDTENRRYIFVIPSDQEWKVDVGLARLRKGNLVRSMAMNTMKAPEVRGLLGELGWG
jgi:hypothetical protein